MFKKLLILLSFAAAAASAKPVLTVYTYSSFNTQWGAGPGLKAAFEKVCDCEVKYVALDHGVMILNRLRQEGEQNGADVIIGIDNTLMQTALDTGLFAPSGVDTSKLKLPDGWTDPVFVPYDYGWFSFVYDKTRLKNPPRSLHELVESQEPWTVIYSDPRVSTPGQGFMLWMQKVFGDDAPAAWEKLAKKTVTVTKGSSEAYSLFSKGESDMALYYSTSPAYQLMKTSTPPPSSMKGIICRWKSPRAPAPASSRSWRRNSSSSSSRPLSRKTSPPPTGSIRRAMSRCRRRSPNCRVRRSRCSSPRTRCRKTVRSGLSNGRRR